MKSAAEFLVNIGRLHRPVVGDEFQTSFSRTLQDKFGIRRHHFTADLSALMGLAENPFDSIEVVEPDRISVRLTELVLDSMARQFDALPSNGNLKNHTPDPDWLGPARKTKGGLEWELKRDLLTTEMFMALPADDPVRARWLLGTEAFRQTNRVLSHSTALSLVIDEAGLAARRAWHTMADGFQPALPARLVLKTGSHPHLELRITQGKENEAAFRVFRANVKNEAAHSDVFDVRFTPKNIPKSIRLYFAPQATVDRNCLALAWAAIRCWIQLLQELQSAQAAGTFSKQFRYPQKTEKYRIEDPFQRMLVAKYENEIDWNKARITTATALVEHVKEVLLPKLQAKTEPQGANYCKRVPKLRRLLEHGGENLADTRALLEREGELAAEAHLLRLINGRKSEAFKEWWRYLSQDNPLSCDNPAFQYLLLRPVIESSNASTYCPPMPLNAEAVAGLYSAIKDEKILPNRDLLKAYQRLVAEGTAAVAPTGQGVRWLVFKKLPENAIPLAAIAKGSGWCIADPYYARRYLESGASFHILLVDGRPRAALRVLDREIRVIVECQGERNEDPGDDYWPHILFYTQVRFLFFDPASELSRTEEFFRLRDEIPTEISNLEVQPLADKLRANPYLVQFASKAQENDPNYAEILRVAWERVIIDYPAGAALAPTGFGFNQKLKEQWNRRFSESLELWELYLLRLL